MQAIVFVLRGCPAGWLGAYGNEWVVTPDLDSFAAGAAVFDRHVSDCPNAEAAHRAWRTGRFQVPPLSRSAQTPPPGPDLLNELRQAGVHTVLLQANHPDTDVNGFADGWGEVIEARPQADDDSPLEELTRAFPVLLDRLADVPRWLLWVEIDRLLPPWDVSQEVFQAYLNEEADGDDDEPEEADEEADGDDESEDEAEDETEAPGEEEGEDESEEEPEPEAVPEEPVTPWADPPTGLFDANDRDAWDWLHFSFAAVVSSLDVEIGRLFAQVRERKIGSTAVVALTSDFGWPLGEHGQLGTHRPWLHEELVHLPLMLRVPLSIAGPRRIDAHTQPADLMPTLLELFGVPVPADHLQGKSLWPLIRGEAEAVHPFAISGLTTETASEWAIRTAEWACLSPGDVPENDPPRQAKLFAKPDDRWEVNDLQQHHLEWVEHLRAVLRNTVEAAGRPGPLAFPELKPLAEFERKND